MWWVPATVGEVTAVLQGRFSGVYVQLWGLPDPTALCTGVRTAEVANGPMTVTWVANGECPPISTTSENVDVPGWGAPLMKRGTETGGAPGDVTPRPPLILFFGFSPPVLVLNELDFVVSDVGVPVVVGTKTVDVSPCLLATF